MLYGLSEVKEEFFKMFRASGGSSKVILWEGTPKQKIVKVMYSRESGEDRRATTNVEYPVVSILDYAPTPAEDWTPHLQAKKVEGFTRDGESAHLYYEPQHLEFRFDVSIASKKFVEFTAMQDFFWKNYLWKKSTIFKGVNLGVDGEVGSVVKMSTRSTDVPRTDGVMEINYEFTITAWVSVREAEMITLLETINVNLINQ